MFLLPFFSARFSLLVSFFSNSTVPFDQTVSFCTARPSGAGGGGGHGGSVRQMGKREKVQALSDSLFQAVPIFGAKTVGRSTVSPGRGFCFLFVLCLVFVPPGEAQAQACRSVPLLSVRECRTVRECQIKVCEFVCLCVYVCVWCEYVVRRTYPLFYGMGGGGGQLSVPYPGGTAENNGGSCKVGREFVMGSFRSTFFLTSGSGRVG